MAKKKARMVSWAMWDDCKSIQEWGLLKSGLISRLKVAPRLGSLFATGVWTLTFATGVWTLTFATGVLAFATGVWTLTFATGVLAFATGVWTLMFATGVLTFATGEWTLTFSTGVWTLTGSSLWFQKGRVVVEVVDVEDIQEESSGGR